MYRRIRNTLASSVEEIASISIRSALSRNCPLRSLTGAVSPTLPRNELDEPRDIHTSDSTFCTPLSCLIQRAPPWLITPSSGPPSSSSCTVHPSRHSIVPMCNIFGCKIIESLRKVRYLPVARCLRQTSWQTAGSLRPARWTVRGCTHHMAPAITKSPPLAVSGLFDILDHDSLVPSSG